MVQEENSEYDHVILMVTTALEGGNREENAWYLDTGCSNHMTGRKDWLVDLDLSKKGKI